MQELGSFMVSVGIWLTALISLPIMITFIIRWLKHKKR